MSRGSRRYDRAVWSWAAYDWANSAFALTVMTTFVPLLLAGYWNDGAPSSVGTFRLGMANSLSSLAVALLVPVIGALADRSGRRRAWLIMTTMLGVCATGALALVRAGQWELALGCYVAGAFAFAVANALYDSLLVGVAPAGELDRVSALGYGVGYIGSALLFGVNAVMVASPATFGFATADAAARAGFVMVALWWLVFSIPLARWVPEPPVAAPAASGDVWRELLATLREVRADPTVWRFLLAYWLYIDAVYTIIKMAVDYGLAIGLGPDDLVLAILATNVVAFPAAIAFGWLAGRIGTRRGVLVGLLVYIGATIAAPSIETAAGFYALAIVVGLVQGGVQSLSRSLFARLVPPQKSAEYFGFYNMVGKFAAIIGPALAGIVALATGSQRIGILSLLALFIAGALLLASARDARLAGTA